MKFECRYHSTVDVVMGLVVGVHVDEGVLTEGMVDVAKTMSIARCGYYQYAVVRETFEMVIPGSRPLLWGLEEKITTEKREKEEMREEQVEG